MRKTVRWDNLTRTEIEEQIKDDVIVIIPTGSTEQHGPHLAVGSDAIIITEIAERVAAEVVKRGKKCLVGPTLSIGNSIHHMSFVGTITLQPSTYIQVLTEYCRCLKTHGVRRIIIINGHGGNTNPNNLALITINEELGFPVFHVGFWAGGEKEMADVVETQDAGTIHACEGETSLLMAYDESLILPCYKELKGNIERPGLKPEVKLVSTFHRMEWTTENGIEGNTYAATKEKGEKLLEISVRHLTDILCCDQLWEDCK